jgi:PTS system cellobiose-specific IIB component
MRILIVCGAGASSTFVALRVRRTVAARGLEHVVEAGSVERIPEATETLGGELRPAEASANRADIVLIGPHLSEQFDELNERIERSGGRAVLLPSDIFTDASGDRALDLALAAPITTP